MFERILLRSGFQQKALSLARGLASQEQQSPHTLQKLDSSIEQSKQPFKQNLAIDAKSDMNSDDEQAAPHLVILTSSSASGGVESTNGLAISTSSVSNDGLLDSSQYLCVTPRQASLVMSKHLSSAATNQQKVHDGGADKLLRSADSTDMNKVTRETIKAHASEEAVHIYTSSDASILGAAQRVGDKIGITSSVAQPPHSEKNAAAHMSTVVARVELPDSNEDEEDEGGGRRHKKEVGPLQKQRIARMQAMKVAVIELSVVGFKAVLDQTSHSEWEQCLLQIRMLCAHTTSYLNTGVSFHQIQPRMQCLLIFFTLRINNTM